MATSFETRDLRSANKEWKRNKDSTTKWSYGQRALPGVGVDSVSGEFLTGTPAQHAKFRPMGKQSWSLSTTQKREHNIVKARSNWDMPNGRVRSKIYAQKEISDVNSRSTGELSPLTPGLSRRQSLSDNVLYSFDRAETPGRPLTLDIFVKTTGRETEKLIEREYEVLDVNGEPLKGRKARRHLRQIGGAEGVAGGSKTVLEDDGFELV